MDQVTIEQRLTEIDRKLGLMTEQMEAARRQQRELAELKADLGRIATDVFQSAADELEEVAPYVETGDLVHLGKKLLRNTRNLSRMLDRLESISDFVADAAPLQKAAFVNLLATLDEMDRQGYFALLAELKRVADNVVASFSPQDVRLLGDNIVSILMTVRNLTQPEILTALNNALAVYQQLEVDVDDDVTIRRLIKEARSPEFRRGLAIGIRFLKNVSKLEPRPAPAAEAAGRS